MIRCREMSDDQWISARDALVFYFKHKTHPGEAED